MLIFPLDTENKCMQFPNAHVFLLKPALKSITPSIVFNCLNFDSCSTDLVPIILINSNDVLVCAHR